MVWHPCGPPKQLQCILSSDGCGCPLTVLGHLRCVRKQIKLPRLNCASCNLRWALNSSHISRLLGEAASNALNKKVPPMHSKAVENKSYGKDVTCIHCFQDGIELASVSLFDSVLGLTRAVCREEFYWKEREGVARTNITKVMQTCQPLAHFSICACHPCAGAMLIFSVSFQFLLYRPFGDHPIKLERYRED